TDLSRAALIAEIYRNHYMISRNNLLPSVNASGTGSSQGSLSGGSVSSQYKVGLGATSYEIDLYCRVRSTSEASMQGYFNVA
ncbi:multidrug transporter, partial [Neisseria sp. P0009.S004]